MLVTVSQPYGAEFQNSSSNASGNCLPTVLHMDNLIKFNQAALQVQPGQRPLLLEVGLLGFVLYLPPVKPRIWMQHL